MKRPILSATTAIACLAALSAVASANNFVTGSSSSGDVTLNDANNWEIIRSATVNIPAGDLSSHGCVATASADMNHGGPEGVESQYRFVLSRNNTNPTTNGGSERIVELVNNASVNDPNSKPVATTQHFTGVTNDNGLNGTGTHTFYFLGRKVEAGDSDSTVEDASLSVICVDTP
jgi:hypothetical protein